MTDSLFFIAAEAIKWKSVLFGFFGGLAIFLFGIHFMGEGLQLFAGNKLKIIIEKATNNVFKGILLGVLVTGLIQSSSGTTAIVVALITAGLMTVRQSLGIILGANIGTTVTSFLIGIKIGEYALPIIVIGAILFLFLNRNKRVMYFGQVLMGFGLLFHGLGTMGGQLKVLQQLQQFQDMLKSVSNTPVLGLVVGTFFTCVIQSSSATIGIVQEFFANGAVTYPSAFAMVLGANIGTTITGILAAFGGNKASKQTALAHTLFNIIGSLLFMLILIPFTDLMLNLFGSQGEALQIAYAHGAFNIITVLIFIPFIGPLTKLLNIIIKPDAAEAQEEFLLNEKLLDTPAFALEQAKTGLEYAARLCLKSGDLAFAYFSTRDEATKKELFNVENMIDKVDRQVKGFLIKLTDHKLNEAEVRLHSMLFQSIKEVERVGDHYRNIILLLDDAAEHQFTLSEAGQKDVERMFKYASSMIAKVIEAVDKFSPALAREVLALEKDMDSLEKNLRSSHYIRLKEKTCDIEASSVYVDLLNKLARIGDHCYNVANFIINPEIEVDAIDFNKIDKLLGLK